MKVGFIGLGIMGKPMAGHLIRNGYETYLFDLNTAAVKELENLGGKACTSNKELAGHCDVIFTMLPAGKHVRQVLFSEEGIAKNGNPNTIIIDMSSVSPEESKSFAQEL